MDFLAHEQHGPVVTPTMNSPEKRDPLSGNTSLSDFVEVTKRIHDVYLKSWPLLYRRENFGARNAGWHSRRSELVQGDQRSSRDRTSVNSWCPVHPSPSGGMAHTPVRRYSLSTGPLPGCPGRG